MAPKRKAVKRKATEPPSSISAESSEPATISDLSADVLLRTLALTGQPARYASVCRHWNSILANSSEVWKRCVLSASPDQQNAVLADTGAMLRWLLPRRTCIKFITFRNFTTSARTDGGMHFLPFFSTAVGVLAAGAPLQSWRFENCSISPKLLPQLRLLAGCTSLYLDRLACAIGTSQQLSEQFKALPLLKDVSVVYSSADQGASPWPDGLAACGRLRRCRIADLCGRSPPVPLPDSISCLRSLEYLTISGFMVNKLPPGLGQLSALSMLRLLAPQHAERQPLQLPPEVSQLSASLRRLSFFSRTVPPDLTALQALSRLSLAGLLWTSDQGTQVAQLSVLTNIASLRLHHCVGLHKTWSGLFSLLNALPKLQEGIPGALRRATSCRKLQLSVKSWDALTQGGTQPLSACALLGMWHLKTLVLQQPAWSHADVTSVLALQGCFHASPAFRGPAPEIVCPTPPAKHAQWASEVATAESSDDEDGI